MCKFIRKIFAYIRKKQYLCSRFLIESTKRNPDAALLRWGERRHQGF